MTYLQILNLIRDTALAQPNVNTVVREFVDLNREDTVYSAVVIQDRDGEYDRIVENGYHTYTWHLGYVDRLTYDEGNRDDIFSTGINIINNIVNSIRNTYFPTLEIDLVDKFNTFNQRFTASCAGVYVVLSVNVQVSDCTDPAADEMYGKFETKITENGEYHFVPDGKPVDEINITVDVPDHKPEEHLVEKITTNGVHNFFPSEGSVFSDVSIDVDVSDKVLKKYRGFYDMTPTSDNIFLYPSDIGADGFSEVEIEMGINTTNITETFTSNSVYRYEVGDSTVGNSYIDYVDITVSVPVPRISSLITMSVLENGTYRWGAGTGEAWDFVEIPVDVHPSTSLVETITNNGVTRFSGEWKDAEITVAVSQAKPEEALSETITSNGSYSYSPTPGSVFSSVALSVDVHPSMSLERRYHRNGYYSLTGEWKDGLIITDIHPSQSLVETITSNGTTSFSGEWKDASISVDVHPSSSLVETITSNGTTSFSGEWRNATITTDVHPSQRLVQTITVNGLTTLSGEWKDADITVSIPDGSFPEPGSDEIYYITYTGNVLDVFDPSDFDANFVSNTYDSTRGFCVLKFDGPITKVGINAFNNKPQLKKMRLPDSVTRIGAQSFKDSGIIEIQMDGVVRIDNAAFFNSYAQVTPLTIPEGCETITSNAYAYCTAAAIIRIPSTVNFIGHTAFRYCSNLEMVYIYATVPPTLEDDNGTYDQFFDTDGNMTIIVPSGTLSTYQNAAGWSTYASRIVEMQ